MPPTPWVKVGWIKFFPEFSSQSTITSHFSSSHWSSP
ncbi:hypothetical protein SLEP1_g2437 [Rubroshorea leprosula]|uniref:Uncharacterized protein n=1 Tax=Rubroshorea leprosula TaxID=152421 RepID=A0AAV5HLL1_9ROSI|nr:hypothetical protein SLEP1_g2437 [Rubroshorea leprosula]